MYTGSLDAVANNETWEVALSCTDSESGDLIDFTGCLIEVELSDVNSCRRLFASTDNGGVALVESTVAVFTFEESEMRGICAGTYNVGIRASLNGRYASLAACSMAVIDGNTR